MPTNPYRSPDTVSQSPELKSGQWKRMLFGLLAVTGVIVVLVALLLPATRSAREPARRSQCGNNLKQIALALRGYESVHHSLPPAYTVDEEGKPLHSWRTLILPFMDLQSLYDTIDLSKPWHDPANKAAYETTLTTYQCPSADCPATHTTYLAIVGPDSCFRPTAPRKISEIIDDQDWTLMVMETDAGQSVHWMSPADATEFGSLNHETAVVSPHPKGANVATVSGRVLFLRADLPPAQLRALISINGKDDAIASRAD